MRAVPPFCSAMGSAMWLLVPRPKGRSVPVLNARRTGWTRLATVRRRERGRDWGTWALTRTGSAASRRALSSRGGRSSLSPPGRRGTPPPARRYRAFAVLGQEAAACATAPFGGCHPPVHELLDLGSFGGGHLDDLYERHHSPSRCDRLAGRRTRRTSATRTWSGELCPERCEAAGTITGHAAEGADEGAQDVLAGRAGRVRRHPRSMAALRGSPSCVGGCLGVPQLDDLLHGGGGPGRPVEGGA